MPAREQFDTGTRLFESGDWNQAEARWQAGRYMAGRSSLQWELESASIAKRDPNIRASLMFHIGMADLNEETLSGLERARYKLRSSCALAAGFFPSLSALGVAELLGGDSEAAHTALAAAFACQQMQDHLAGRCSSPRNVFEGLHMLTVLCPSWAAGHRAYLRLLQGLLRPIAANTVGPAAPAAPPPLPEATLEQATDLRASPTFAKETGQSGLRTPRTPPSGRSLARSNS